MVEAGQTGSFPADSATSLRLHLGGLARRGGKGTSYQVRYPGAPLLIKVYVHVLKPLEELFYWIRTHTYNRYHLLDLRSESNGYTWDFRYSTGMMLYANFGLF